MLATWDAFDVSANDEFDGDFAAALGAIRAPTIVMPGSSDLYFPPEDSAIEVGLIPGAELRIIESDWGHIAGSPVYDTASNPAIDVPSNPTSTARSVTPAGADIPTAACITRPWE